MSRQTGRELSLRNKFLQFIEEKELFTTREIILLGVSGGIDSMVMTSLFVESGFPLAIAHCNFNLRGEESDKDEDLVREYSERNKIRFFSVRFETGEYARKNGISIQMAARELRYNWFEELRMSNGFSSIAIAHNLNDSIETMLINLVRGTGITGLTGIKPKSGFIIRPLLFATRKEIGDYATAKGIVFREDRSNSDVKYARNKIRHKIIPILKEINPSLETTLYDTAERFSMIDKLLEGYINTVRNEVSFEREGCIIYRVDRLKTYTGNLSVLYELFSPFGVKKDMLNTLASIIHGKTGSFLKTPDRRILKNRDEIIVTTPSIASNTEIIINSLDDFSTVNCIKSAIILDIDSEFIIPSGNDFCSIDFSELTFPVIIRHWKKGDYFFPFGMSQKKKLSDYFTDRKFSLADKEEVLVMVSDNRIVWIIGERADNRFRITNTTKKALVLRSES